MKANERRKVFDAVDLLTEDTAVSVPATKVKNGVTMLSIDSIKPFHDHYKGPGTNYDKVGKYTGIGVFTIVAEADGEGATKWGKLKSGAGWISLDYAKRI